VQRAPVNGTAARLTLRREVARKALHLVFVVVPVAYAFGFPRKWLLVALGAGALVAVVVELARAWHAPTRARFVRWVGALLREHEHARWSGATWMILSMLAVVAFAPRGVAVAAMWAITAGDAAAALVGRAFERRGDERERSGGTGVATDAERARDGESMGANRTTRAGSKTIRGSAACFVVTMAGALMLARLGAMESVVAAVLATAAERYGEPVDDNARIAAAVALGIALWHMVFS